MRSIHSRTLATLVALAAAMLVAACGGDGNDSGASTDPVAVKLIALNDFHGNI